MTVVRHLCAVLSAAFAAAACAVTPSEITVGLALDSLDYVSGENVGAVVSIVNVSPDTLSAGRANSPDRFFVEVFRSSDMSQLQRVSDLQFVAPFTLKPNEAQKLAVRLANHYGLRSPGRYMAKPVLVHGETRYEGQMRVFAIVPGMGVTKALQIFSNRDGLKREFSLVSWSRGGREHLFLTARDLAGDDAQDSRHWQTVDLGEMMKITRPTISVMPGGEVVVLHRIDPDNFVRSEFWSVPDGIEFHRRELVQDPETAGSQRVREMYLESGGIKPKENPWWKFW